MRNNLISIFPKTIFLIGAGGTGGRLAEELRFFLQTAISIDRNLVNTEIVIIDHDTVELRNCLRQPFNYMHIGLNKAYVKAQYLAPFCNVKHIPEPLNMASLELVFTPERIQENFLVISAVDNIPTRSMIYYYLLENATKDQDKFWYWIFTGGDLKLQKINELLSISGVKNEDEFDIPYVTNLGWGYYHGYPTTLTAPHIRFPEEFPEVTGFGMNYNNTVVGCGLAPEDQVRQSYTMNNMASVMTMFMMDRLYFDGLIIDQMTFMNGQTDTVYVGSIEEIDTKIENAEALLAQMAELVQEPEPEPEPNEATLEALQEESFEEYMNSDELIQELSADLV